MTLHPESVQRCGACAKPTLHYRGQASAVSLLRLAAWMLLLPSILYGACTATDNIPGFLGPLCGLVVAAFFVVLGCQQFNEGEVPAICGECGAADGSVSHAYKADRRAPPPAT